ncbi:hypothetical protein FGB62_118g014 [Gracilaria domingensis]|nr:hypothetical protein FGB62_118g014 [Gracilaria domingensis]
MVDGCYVNAATVDDVTEDMLRQSLRKHSELEFRRLRIDDWEKIVGKLSMNMNLSDDKSRVWQLVVDYKEAVRDVRYLEAIEHCPEVAIRHLRERTRPPELQDRMDEIIVMERRTKLHKDSFCDYAKRLAEEPQIVEQAGVSKSSLENREAVDVLQVIPNCTGNVGKRACTPDDVAVNSLAERKKVRLCWNTETCPGEAHLLKDCPRTSLEERKKIWSRIREEAKKGKMSTERDGETDA